MRPHRLVARWIRIAGIGFAVGLPLGASAHVVVTPKQAGVGQELVFSVSVPNERTAAVTGLRLLIPNGVEAVTPTVKAGWNIQIKTNSDSAYSSEIDWSNGSIPVGQREDFSFSGQVPSTATTLNWKAYQQYADSTIVSWDQTPKGSDDATGNSGPYSTTAVVNDLTATPKSVSSTTLAALALIGSLAALGFSIAALARKRAS